MSKPRLIIETSPILGHMSGIGHNTLELIKALKKLDSTGIEIQLAVPFDKVGELKRLLPVGFKIKRIPLPIVIYNMLGKFGLLPPLDLFLGKGVYLFPNYRNTPLLFSRSLTYVYDISFILFPQFVSPKNKKYLSNHINKWVNRADLVLTISKSSQAGIAKHWPESKPRIKIVPCGVDKQVFYPRSLREVNAIKHKYMIKDGDYILYVGNIEPRKNLVRLIKAYRMVYDKHPHFKLVLIGSDGWRNDDINDEIKAAQKASYPIVKPFQYVPDKDLPALYSGATMLVHPALYEGFGISPLQAMACGTPVIVADNSSMPEVVKNAGLYVKAESIDDISAKMLKFIEDDKLRSTYRQRGLEQAEKFPWQASAKALLSAVRQELKQSW